MASRWLALAFLAISLPGSARAEGRALLVELEGRGWSPEETDALRARLVEEGYELVIVEPLAPPAPRRVDRAKFAALSKEGLVALARGHLDHAESLLEEALALVDGRAPGDLEDEALAACLDLARIAFERDGDGAATAHVERCRRDFPFGVVDRRRATPEVQALVSAVDARRVALVVEPRGRGCRLVDRDDGPALEGLSALPGVKRALRFACADGLVRTRVVVFGDEASLDVTPSLDERLVPGRALALRSTRPRTDARALGARHGAVVFLLWRDKAGAHVVRASAEDDRTFTGRDAEDAAERLLQPGRRRRVALRRGAAWSLGLASVALYAASFPPMRSRALAADELSRLPHHDPAFLELRDELGADRGPLFRRAAFGAVSGVAAAAIGRPLGRGVAIASAALGAGLAVASFATFASGPTCDPRQETYSSCLVRDVRRDRAFLLAMAAAPLFSISARSLFARRRGLTFHAGAGSILVSVHTSGPSGPSARDRVWFGRKE